MACPTLAASGLDVLLDDGLPFAVEFSGFFLSLLCGRFNNRGFLLDDGLACRQASSAELLGLGDGSREAAAAAAASAFSFAVCSSSPASVSSLSIRPGFSASSAAWMGARRTAERMSAVTEERFCRRCTACEGSALVSPQWADQGLDN